MLIRLAFLSFLVAALFIPALAAPSAQAQDTSLSTASSVAQGLSVLESQSNWDALYDQLHPDSQLTVGRSTVAYWYQTYFAVNGPHPATITGAALVDWTWPVTGRTYPATAEIFYTQLFDNGTTVNDVVRLVQAEDGTWRWFFGRSPEFVRQIAQEAGEFRQDLSIPERAGVPAAALFAEAIAGIDRVLPACFVAAGIAALPQTIGLDSINARQSESGARPESASFLPPNRRDFPDLIANALTLPPGDTPETTVDKIRASQIDWNGPPYTSPPRGLAVDLAPGSSYLILYYEESTEALGFLPVLMWGPRHTNSLFTVVGPAAGLINELVAEWSDNAGASCVG
ncbi:MAG TPA: hypothetical protein VFP05_02435 [Thermomicrobiales bacterium]|nr:hypothetical protein [Thermomicrobiales bacterium]